MSVEVVSDDDVPEEAGDWGAAPGEGAGRHERAPVFRSPAAALEGPFAAGERPSPFAVDPDWVPPVDMQEEQRRAEHEKQLGNEYFRKKVYKKAFTHYSEALVHDPCNAVLYSNRAACWLEMAKTDAKAASGCRLSGVTKSMLQSCVEDSEQSIMLDPKYQKSHYRRIKSLKLLGRLQDANRAAEQALSLFGENIADDMASLCETLRIMDVAELSEKG